MQPLCLCQGGAKTFVKTINGTNVLPLIIYVARSIFNRRLSGSFEHWSHHVVLNEFPPRCESGRGLKARRGWGRKQLGEPQNALAIVFSNPISVAFLLLYTAHIVQLIMRLETPHYLKQLRSSQDSSPLAHEKLFWGWRKTRSLELSKTRNYCSVEPPIASNGIKLCNV